MENVEAPTRVDLGDVRVAAPGEILVTSTVRDLVAGSDIKFTNRFSAREN